MQPGDLDDKNMKEVIREIVKFEEDPSTWGEQTWKGDVNVLSIWDWAESQNRIELMSVIARSVVGHILTTTRFLPEKEEVRQIWSSKMERLAEEAHNEGTVETEARFLEAWLYLNPLGPKALKIVETIISLYRKQNGIAKVAYFLNERATELNSLLVTGNLRLGEDEIWKSLMEAYNLSKSVDYNKGIALALFGLGRYLGYKHKDILALKFLHQADVFAKKARTVYGIAIIEELRKIRDRSGIPPNAYEIEVDPDLLIDEFLKEV